MFNIDNVNTELFSIRVNFNSKSHGDSAIIMTKSDVAFFKMRVCSLNFKNPPSNLRIVVSISDEFGGITDT
jgi:hypothetical protein